MEPFSALLKDALLPVAVFLALSSACNVVMLCIFIYGEHQWRKHLSEESRQIEQAFEMQLYDGDLTIEEVEELHRMSERMDQIKLRIDQTRH